MSSRLKLSLSLCTIACAGLCAAWLRGPIAGIVVLALALACFIAGRLSSAKSDSPHEPSKALELEQRDAQTIAHTPASALLEATMRGMREGVLVINRAMRVAASNDAASAVFKSFQGRLESHRLSELTRSRAIYDAYRTSLFEDRPAEAKVELHDAERRVFELRVVPLRLYGDEEPRAAIGVFFDITRLERLERVRQEFLSNVSHELRTPLTSILAFVETLEGSAIEDAEEGRRFLAIIRRNAQRMNSLIQEILELSAIEAGAVPIQKQELPLHAMVEQILASLSSAAAARRVRFCNEVPAEVAVSADPLRLEQMLTNLLDNALKYNREGGTVTVSYERGARDRIHVTDTGEGIPPDQLERVFERFYRTDRARSAESGGTGLGLAIVKHLALAHGGQVTVRSIPNEGSTFTIELMREENEVRSR